MVNSSARRFPPLLYLEETKVPFFDLTKRCNSPDIILATTAANEVVNNSLTQSFIERARGKCLLMFNDEKRKENLISFFAFAGGGVEYYSNWNRTMPTNVSTLKFTLKNHPQSRDIINKEFLFCFAFSLSFAFSFFLLRFFCYKFPHIALEK